MKLLIAGSRSITDFDFTGYIPKDVDTILTGGATGIDALAEKYADEHGLSKIVIKPQYEKYGKSAPLVRNRELIELCDKVLIVWDGKSRGTGFTKRLAEESGKNTTTVIV